MNVSENLKKYGWLILLIAINLILIGILIRVSRASSEREDLLKKEILAKDIQIKIAEGKYSKLVDSYATESELNKQLEKENKMLKDTIKARGEKILSITNAFIAFRNKSGGVIPLEPKTDSTLTFTSFYPTKENYFIKYSGDVNILNKTVTEDWEFSKFKLGIILTERKDGLWDYYVDAPDYVLLSDIKINSLPPSQYTTKTKTEVFNLYGGFGVTSDFNGNRDKNLYLQGGVGVKGKIIVLGQVNTNKSAGLGLLYKF